MNQSSSQSLNIPIVVSIGDHWHTPLLTDLQIQDSVELENKRKAAVAKLPSWKTPRRQKSYRLLKTKWVFNKHTKLH